MNYNSADMLLANFGCVGKRLSLRLENIDNLQLKLIEFTIFRRQKKGDRLSPTIPVDKKPVAGAVTSLPPKV